jgi:hypothetical protein
MEIFFVESKPFLGSVSRKIKLILACELEKDSRSSESVLKAIKHHLSAYAKEGFSITHILSDAEGGIMALSDTLGQMGIRLNITGSHAQEIERSFRTVKGSCRAHLAVIPFNLPYMFLKWLVKSCCSRVNMWRSNTKRALHREKDRFQD